MSDKELPAEVGSDDRAVPPMGTSTNAPVVAPIKEMSAEADGDRAKVAATTAGEPPVATHSENPTQPGDDGANLIPNAKRMAPVVAGKRRGDGRVSSVAEAEGGTPAITTNTERRPKGRGGKRANAVVHPVQHAPLPAEGGAAVVEPQTIRTEPSALQISRMNEAIPEPEPGRSKPVHAEGGSASCSPTTTGRMPAALDHSDTIAAIRALGRQRTFLIKSINRQTNSVGAYVRTLLGWRADLPEAERAKIAKRAAKAIDAIGRALEDAEDHAVYERIRPIVMASQIACQPFEKLRAETEREMKRLAKTLPAYPFAASVKGFGDLAFAVVVAEAGDVGSYKSRSALWKRLGLAVIDGERQGRRTNAEEAARHGYSPHRRAEVYAVVGESLLKHQWAGEKDDAPAHPTGPYGERYGAKKAEYIKRVEATVDLPYSDKAKWTPKRANEAAKRYMTKCLLRDLYGAWKAAHRLPDTEPYQMAA